MKDVKDIYDQMFYGDLEPIESVELSEDSAPLQKLLYTQILSLEDTLDEDQKALLNQLLDNRSEIEDLLCKEYYKVGIITGYKLIYDAILYGKNVH